MVISDIMLKQKYAPVMCRTRFMLFQCSEQDSHGLKYLHNDCHHLTNAPSWDMLSLRRRTHSLTRERQYADEDKKQFLQRAFRLRLCDAARLDFRVLKGTNVQTANLNKLHSFVVFAFSFLIEGVSKAWCGSFAHDDTWLLWELMQC